MSSLAYKNTEVELIEDMTPQDLLSSIVSIEVTLPGQYECITRSYNAAKTLLKQFKYDQDKELEPLKKETNKIKDRYKPDLDALEQIIDVCKQKVAVYNKFIEQKKQIEDEEIRKTAEIFKVQDLYIPEAPKKLSGDGANTYISKVKRYRVNEICKVPFEYLEINDGAVKLAMKLGKEIPGIEYYEEDKTTLRIR